ncbi:Macrophage erythroblast attacher isoform 1 [Mycena kentingensis (nom. inval.)]|nr:Macrophage erythroblast attacher isoform 1 [Mycena kentingensis (nom. inval.)]
MYYEMPPSPTSSASSASSLSSGFPRTPTSPEYRATGLAIPSLPDYSDAFAPKVQKPSTAERRASHNAVERARRETLNARFLDLAALLPNLRHLRRPSKSAIVSSSLAHVRAARRYRATASLQLRALSAECDALRREVNAWRARSGMRAVAIPIRDDAFAMVLSGEEPAFDPLDLDCGLEDEDDAEFSMLRRRRSSGPPPETACEGPLLLSHPYTAPVPSPSPQASTSAPTSVPEQLVHTSTPPPNTNKSRQHSGSPTPIAAVPTNGFHSQAPVPVVAPFEAPAPAAMDVNAAYLQQQQNAAWAYAATHGQAGW